MKVIRIYVIIILMVIINNIIYSQRSIEIYFGANITNVKYHSIYKNTNIDSSGYLTNTAILPALGLSINDTILPKLIISSGFGIHFMGSKNYTQGLNGPYFIDKNLCLTFINVPFKFDFPLSTFVSLNAGYSFNYNINKNQDFFVFQDQNTISIFNKIQHATQVGLKFKLNSTRLEINYYHFLSKIFDTKNYFINSRNYLTLKALQINFKYSLP